MFLIILIVLGAVALIALPQLWVRHVIEKHSVERPDFPGTGSEFARHVLDEMGLKHVLVEQTDKGDHYDPEAKAVRLMSRHFNRRSLSAVAIAAHEVGHAMQDATGYKPLIARTRLARSAQSIEMIGAALMFAAPIVMVLAKSPAIFMLAIAAGLLIFGITIAMHLVTLPVEFDASFGRAMPVLERGRYLPEKDMLAARRILKAAAYTYVAAALMSMLNVARWFRWIRI